ncbi:Gfo/Idh/MocA family protein [Streptomyces sp. NPDC055709]
MSNRGPLNIALIGAGNISGQYLDTLGTFPDIRLTAIGDLDVSRARTAARKYHVPEAGDPESVLALPDVELVVNLTVPAAHTEVALASLRAGKHVYGEKPLALSPRDGARILAEAQACGLRVGCAPDTFLGAGLQSAQRALQAGAIGEPVSASAVLQGPGPDAWHPSPAFFYAPGAGPLFDMGPYYLTALVALLGPVARVAATARTARSRRVAASGATFPVEVPTHLHTLLDFANGPSATATFSFDSPEPRSLLEITGSEGTLSVPDPNTFAGPLRIRRFEDDDWRPLPVHGTTAGRGLGVLDMARALRTGQDHRASGELALHVLETMTMITEAAETHATAHVTPWHSTLRPLPDDWNPTASTLTADLRPSASPRPGT